MFFSAIFFYFDTTIFYRLDNFILHHFASTIILYNTTSPYLTLIRCLLPFHYSNHYLVVDNIPLYHISPPIALSNLPQAIGPVLADFLSKTGGRAVNGPDQSSDGRELYFKVAVCSSATRAGLWCDHDAWGVNWLRTILSGGSLPVI